MALALNVFKTITAVGSFAIPSSDTANLLAGKLVLESSDVLVFSSSNNQNIKFLASILETLN